MGKWRHSAVSYLLKVSHLVNGIAHTSTLAPGYLSSKAAACLEPGRLRDIPGRDSLSLVFKGGARSRIEITE